MQKKMGYRHGKIFKNHHPCLRMGTACLWVEIVFTETILGTGVVHCSVWILILENIKAVPWEEVVSRGV